MPDIWFPNLGIEIEKLSRVAFSVLGKDVYWYGIFIGLGVILGVVFAMLEAKRTKQDPDLYVDFVIYALIFAIIGARLYYVAFSWDYYSANPAKIFALREGGLAIYGGIIGAVLTAIVYCKKKKVDFWLLADTACPSIAFGQMMGRWGNFFNREAFGGFTDGPFAMRLRLDQVRPGDVSQQVLDNLMNFGGVDYIQVHPTFLYESMWNLCLFLLLVLYRPKKKFAGQIMGLYFLGYALGRVWIEGLRTDQLMIGGFAVSQLLSGAIIVASVAFLIWKGRQEKTAE
ncbi:MAG: prolipoprotein diacylglyceryl transferase [Anaerotignum sp.]|nr:prolipoprotein diacylglyceryl transferase [Anaerotignum sp.]